MCYVKFDCCCFFFFSEKLAGWLSVDFSVKVKPSVWTDDGVFIYKGILPKKPLHLILVNQRKVKLENACTNDALALLVDVLGCLLFEKKKKIYTPKMIIFFLKKKKKN